MKLAANRYFYRSFDKKEYAQTEAKSTAEKKKAPAKKKAAKKGKAKAKKGKAGAKKGKKAAKKGGKKSKSKKSKKLLKKIPKLEVDQVPPKKSNNKVEIVVPKKQPNVAKKVEEGKLENKIQMMTKILMHQTYLHEMQ